MSGPAVVLAVNAGSSSLKFGTYDAQGRPAGCSGQAEGLEPGGRPRVRLQGQDAVELPAAAGSDPFDAALGWLLDTLAGQALQLEAVAHRIVHGGERFTAPVRLDAQALAALSELEALAPLHQPHNLAGVRAFARKLPDVPQIGCFDTAFHASLPPSERRLPLPAAALQGGVRRYGFHGLSYDWAMGCLRDRSSRAQGRVLLMHLGNGSSMCAVRGGRSVATSMGFSALDGLMMGTRCGSLDPGVLLHLLRAGWTVDRLERLLWRESGLLGVSGLSADMRSLRASSVPAAQEAMDLYTHRAVREAGALLALLGGVDALVFTGGIGEHDHALRHALVSALGFAGLCLDDHANTCASGDGMTTIHAARSTAEIWVVPSDEGAVAARAAWAWLGQASGPAADTAPTTRSAGASA